MVMKITIMKMVREYTDRQYIIMTMILVYEHSAMLSRIRPLAPCGPCTGALYAFMAALHTAERVPLHTVLFFITFS